MCQQRRRKRGAGEAPVASEEHHTSAMRLNVVRPLLFVLLREMTGDSGHILKTVRLN